MAVEIGRAWRMNRPERIEARYYGAAWAPFPWLLHVEVSDEEGLSRLKGSKYVESDVKGALRLVKSRIGHEFLRRNID